MKFSILTYNILFNRAKDSILELSKQYHPDIICLQESEAKDEDQNRLEENGYYLADFSNSFIKFGRIFGLATYFNANTLSFSSSTNFNLPRSFYETILLILRGNNNPRSVLKTDFVIREKNLKISVYNIHLTLISSNGSRLKQLKETLSDLTSDSKRPTIITGDFNYPYGRKKFEKLISEYGLQEATNSLFYTIEHRIFWFLRIKFKLDYILFKNMKHVETKRIQIRGSDHFPILSVFDL